MNATTHNRAPGGANAMAITKTLRGRKYRVMKWSAGRLINADYRPSIEDRRFVGQWYDGREDDFTRNYGNVYRLTDGSYIATGCGDKNSEFGRYLSDGETREGRAMIIIDSKANLQRWAVGRDINWRDTPAPPRSRLGFRY